jgi:hypothetical protein
LLSKECDDRRFSIYNVLAVYIQSNEKNYTVDPAAGSLSSSSTTERERERERDIEWSAGLIIIIIRFDYQPSRGPFIYIAERSAGAPSPPIKTRLPVSPSARPATATTVEQ